MIELIREYQEIKNRLFELEKIIQSEVEKRLEESREIKDGTIVKLFRYGKFKEKGVVIGISKSFEIFYFNQYLKNPERLEEDLQVRYRIGKLKKDGNPSKIGYLGSYYLKDKESWIEIDN